MIRLTDILIDEAITDKLPGKMNPAAQQAHKQGLHSIGFGRWANDKGQMVAKTVDGRLQTVSPGPRTEPKDRNPKTMPLNRGVNQGGPSTAADPADMREKILRAVQVKGRAALKKPEVQNIAKKGIKMTGAQMTRLTGIPEKAFRVTAEKPDYLKGGSLVYLDPHNSIAHDAETDTYTIASDIWFPET